MFKKWMIVTVLALFLAGCGETTKPETQAEPEVNKPAPAAPAVPAAPAAPAAKASPPENKTNQATATFLGRTLSDMKVIGAVKLSKYTMITLNKGRIRVMLAVPELAKGSYEASTPGQGIALTLSGAGKPGTISVRAMRSAKIEIQKDGEIIEGTYTGFVAGADEEPIELKGDFRFERKMIP